MAVREMIRAACALVCFVGSAWGETMVLTPVPVTDWKSVFGTIEPRDSVASRARIGGTVTELGVTEGDQVTAGQRIAVIRDEKIAFQIKALEARIGALNAQLATAETELARGEALVDRGVATVQHLDQLRLSADVVRNQLAAAQADRAVAVQQSTEGEVLAPAAGRVLGVPVTEGSVVLAGEPVASIGGGGLFLRLAIPERYAATLSEGAEIRMAAAEHEATGRLAKIYPLIENGRVIADVEVEGLPTGFVNARVLVELPVAERDALLVPRAAVETRAGLEYVTIDADGTLQRQVVLTGTTHPGNDGDMVEILTGLRTGDVVVLP